MKQYLRYSGLAFVFLWFFGGGIGHFVSTEFFLSIVPPWVPYPLAAVYISGAIEIVLSLMLLWPQIRPQAGWGIIALTLAVTPANIHMWLNPDSFPEISPDLLSARLVVQILLILLIWWSSRVPNTIE